MRVRVRVHVHVHVHVHACACACAYVRVYVVRGCALRSCGRATSDSPSGVSIMTTSIAHAVTGANGAVAVLAACCVCMRLD